VADVIQFTPKPKPPIPLERLAADAIDDLLGEWERHVRVNMLGEFLRQHIPMGNDPARSYTSSLADVAWACEQSGMTFAVFSPGSLSTNMLGWVVIMMVGDKQVATPPMATELYARMFAVLLHWKLKRS
jgi:hypothetical protein